MSQIQPETEARLNSLIGDFVGQGAEYYRKIFGYMMEAPGYRFTINSAAGLLGPVWFGARGLWSWFLTFAILETFALIQIGQGLFGDLGREFRNRADGIAQTLETRRAQIEAAERTGASSLDALKRATASLETAYADALAAAEAADATGLTYILIGLV
ncbi:MAG: glycine/betaine ABC transporter, partial [Pseudomonadota bacterium]